jgi:hypothetical protein
MLAHRNSIGMPWVDQHFIRTHYSNSELTSLDSYSFNTAIILFRWYVYTIQDDISQLYYYINVLKTMAKSFNVKDSISIKHITVVFIKGGN